MSLNRATVFPFAVSALSLAVSLQVQAQGVLEEVIVTAEKREASLQDTPLAISAFTNDDLRAQLVNGPMDLQMNVPNLLMTKSNFTTANISIRGIGNLAIGSAGDSGTGIHINGFYMAAPRVFEMDFFDVERVEVLRGPQGTLYGRNTTAGVLNMITAKPDTEGVSGNINAEFGNYNHQRYEGFVNFPLTDNLAQRFSGFYLKRDGFVDNAYNGDEIDDRDMFGLRSSTLWSDDDTSIQLVVNYLEEDDSRMRGSEQKCTKDTTFNFVGQYGPLGCLPTSLENGITNGGGTITGAINGAIGAATGIPFPADDYANSPSFSDVRTQLFDTTPRYQIEDTVVTLEINQDFGDLTLTSVTGYHDTMFSAHNDYDFNQASEVWPITQIPGFPYDVNGDGIPDGAVPNPFFCTPSGQVGFCSSGGIPVNQGPNGTVLVDRLYSSDLSFTEGDEWSQELRLASNWEGPWNFMLGAYYLRYQGDTHYYVHSSTLSFYGLVPLLGGGQPLPENMRMYDNDSSDYTLKTWAAFGELYWQVNDRMRWTFGLRYSDEKKSADQRTIYLDFLDNPNAPGGDYEKFAWDNSEPTGRINLTYDVSDDVMAYAQVSRSFKSGGFNPISRDSLLVQLDPSAAFFEPEFINAFEVGVKSRLLDGALQANATYFYYDYEGLQVSKIVQQTSINENFDATIQGIEGEFLFAATENLILTANVAWLDTEMGSGNSIDPGDPNASTYINDGRGPTDGVISLGNANTYVGADCPNPTPIPQLGGLPGCAGIPIDLRDNVIPGSPEFSVNLGASYTVDLGDNGTLRAGVNYYWQDSYYSRVFNSDIDRIEEWDVWNATLRYTPTSERWFVELWGRNLTDDDYVTGQYRIDPSSGLGTNQFLLEPMTVGLTLDYIF